MSHPLAAEHTAAAAVEEQEGSPSSPTGSPAEDMDPHHVLDLVVISQLLAPRRQHIFHAHSKAALEEPVTADMLRPLVSDTCAHTGAAGAAGGGGESDAETQRLIDAVFERLHTSQLHADRITLKQILTFDLDGYPVLTSQSYMELVRLSEKKTVVHKTEVGHVLQPDEHFLGGEHAFEEVVESLFKFESKTVTCETLRDVLLKLEREPNKIRISREYIRQLVKTQRQMVTFVPFLIVFIVTFVLLAQTDLWNQFSGELNGSTPTEPWRNYCQAGGVTGECMFHRKTLHEGGTFSEIVEFVKSDVVEDLWKYVTTAAGSADSVPFNGFWLVGALVVRVSPYASYPDSAALKPCSHLKLSPTGAASLVEQRLGRQWDCRSFASAVVPFSANKSYALDKLHHLNLAAPVFDDVSIIIQYAMVNPATGGVVLVNTLLAIPQYGSVLAKFHTQVVDGTLDTVILACMVMSLVLFVLDCVTLVLFRSLRHNRPDALFNIILHLLGLAFIIAAYSLTRVRPATIGNIYQSTHFVEGLDTAAANAENAHLLFGLWILIFFAVFIQYLSFFPGLKVLVKLVRVLMPDVLALFLFFITIYIMFAMIAKMLFGSTSVAYSSFVNANGQMVQYYLLHFDLKQLMMNYPQLGFLFYYVFRIFILYIMINFFIVTIIAPIRMVWLEGDLPILLSIVLAGTKQTVREAVWFHVESVLIVLAELVFNSRISNVRHYLAFHDHLEALYTPGTPATARLEACLALLDLRAHPNVDPLFSERSVTIETTRLSCCDASYFLCRLAVQSESNIVFLRDARLMALLGVYDAFKTTLEWELEVKEAEEDEVFPPPRSLAAAANARRKNAVHGRLSKLLHKKIQVEAAADSSAHHEPAPEPASPRTQQQASYNFHFTRHLLHGLRFHLFPSDVSMVLWTVVDRLAMFALFVTMFVTVVQTPRAVAFFSLNAHMGLRDLHYHQSCDDAACTSGLMRRWTWDDNLRLEHLQLYAERLLGPQAYPDPAHRKVPNLSGQASAVGWDSYVYVEGPITVRQIRSKVATCKAPFLFHDSAANFPSTASTIAMQDRVLRGTACGVPLKPFATTAMARPAGSLLDASAYTYSKTCSEMDPESTHGTHYHHYPCAGYTAVVRTKAQLIYALSAPYLDGATRFVSIVANLRDARDPRGVVLQYQLLSEFSHGGSAGIFWAHSIPSKDPEIRDITLDSLILLSIDCGLAVIGFVLRSVTSLRKSGHLQQHVFIGSQVLRVLIYVAFVAVYFGAELAWWGHPISASIVIAWLALQFVFMVVFPVCQFFFLRATIVNAFLALTARKVLYIIPIFASIMVSFTLAGYAMWGSSAKEFSTLYHSFLAVSQGFLGDFEALEIYERNPTFAMLYTVSFIVIVIIFALNLLLAVIAGCADESREHTAVFQPIVTVARYLKQPVYFGPVMRVVGLFMLDHGAAATGDDGAPASNGRVLRNLFMSLFYGTPAPGPTPTAGTRSSSLHSAEKERLPTPLECMSAAVGSFVAHEVSNALRMQELGETQICSMVALVIQEHAHFRHAQPGSYAEDVALDIMMQGQLEHGTAHCLQQQQQHGGGEASGGKATDEDVASRVIRSVSKLRLRPSFSSSVRAEDSGAEATTWQEEAHRRKMLKQGKKLRLNEASAPDTQAATEKDHNGEPVG